jgi:hypothetical protein
VLVANSLSLLPLVDDPANGMIVGTVEEPTPVHHSLYPSRERSPFSAGIML